MIISFFPSSCPLFGFCDVQTTWPWRLFVTLCVMKDWLVWLWLWVKSALFLSHTSTRSEIKVEWKTCPGSFPTLWLGKKERWMERTSFFFIVYKQFNLFRRFVNSNKNLREFPSQSCRQINQPLEKCISTCVVAGIHFPPCPEHTAIRSLS